MLKKAIKKLSKVTARKRETPPARLLTAEGWKRLMMKKHRNSQK